MKKLFTLVAACGLGFVTIGCTKPETPKPAEPATPAVEPAPEGTPPAVDPATPPADPAAPAPEPAPAPAPAEGTPAPKEG